MSSGTILSPAIRFTIPKVLNVWHARAYQGRRSDEVRQDSGDFVRSAARENGHGRRGRRKSADAEKILSRLRRLRQVDQRMADKLHRNRGLAIDGLLEGKDHEHAVGNLPHRLHPPGTPRPQLRADVVDGGRTDRRTPRRKKAGDAQSRHGRLNRPGSIAALILMSVTRRSRTGWPPRRTVAA